MKSDQIRQVAVEYSNLLAINTYAPARMDKTVRSPSIIQQGRHAAWMCLEILEMVRYEEKREKAMRWLAFTQAILWNLGLYSIQEMADHNRSISEP